jgi:hypothetical protein
MVASLRVWTKAVRRAGFAKTEYAPPGRFLPIYHCVEKPCQELRERPLLNENITATNTGASDQTMYTHVAALSTCGFRHGSFHHVTGPRIRVRFGAAAVTLLMF